MNFLGLCSIAAAAENDIITHLMQVLLYTGNSSGNIKIRNSRNKNSDSMHGIETKSLSKNIWGISVTVNDIHDLFSGFLTDLRAVIYHSGNSCNRYICHLGNVINIHSV